MIFIFVFIPPKCESLIKEGLEYSYRDQYKKALSSFNRVIREYPQLPYGYFFKGALYQLVMTDYVTDSLSSEYLNLMKITEEKSKKLWKKEKDIDALFFYGAVFLYRTIFEGWRENYWQALSFGLKAYKYLKEVVKRDRTYYDAYIGLGLYNYFAGRVDRYLMGFKIFGDVNKGIELIKITANKGRFLDVTARHSLNWIYTEEKNFDAAIRGCEELLSIYPENRLFKWQLSLILMEKGDWNRALRVTEKLLEEVKREQGNHYYNISELNYRIAYIEYRKGDRERAKSYLKEAERLYPFYKGRYKADSLYKEIKKLKEKL